MPYINTMVISYTTQKKCRIFPANIYGVEFALGDMVTLTLQFG
jgi:hypothetical protein